jgi:predicted MFS family arabinose efflux permease
MLAAGMLVAGASAGLVFPPFSDAVATGVRPDRRGRVLSAISAGTGWGVALAAPVAILAGTAWRSAWLAFAIAMVLATLWAARVLPAHAAAAPAARRAPLSWRWIVCPRSGPLLAGAALIGLGSSVYWTFAVDFLVSSDALSVNASRAFLLVVGVASIVGSAAGDVVRRTGARAAFSGMTWALGASVALLALSPDVPALAVPSAILFGAAYNLVLAVQGIWSTQVFADRPSTGLAAVMFALGIGLLLGPLLAGLAAGAVAMNGVLLIAAALLGAVSLLAPRERLDLVIQPD